MGKPRANLVTDEMITREYEISRSGQQAAKTLGISTTTVQRVLTKLSVPRFGIEHWRQTRKLYRGCEPNMRSDYETGATYEQLIDKYGPGSIWSVKEALARAGTVLRDNLARKENNEEIDRIRELNAEGMAQVAISLAIGRSQSFVSRLMRRHGIETHGGRFGADHSCWKGGRLQDSSGYIRVWVSPDDPMASMRLHDSYVLEHRLVMARKLGHPLLRSETVHHKDGNHSNNHPDNLQLRQGKHGKHSAWRCRCCGSYDVEPVAIED